MAPRKKRIQRQNKLKAMPKKANCSKIFADDLENQDVLDIASVEQEADQPRHQATVTVDYSKITKVFNDRPTIIIYSPGEEFGTKINNGLMLVTKEDIEKRLDPKYHRYQDLWDEIVVPVQQFILYQPPIDMTQSCRYDNESEDDLITSYTRSGHFFLFESTEIVYSSPIIDNKLI